MLSFKFQKTQNAVFISHIDVLRITNRTLRRMGMPVEYSKGFNPHLLLNLSQPLPLGIASFAEWATAQTDFDDEAKFLSLYNSHCPNNFLATECYITEERPNVAGNVTASDYFIKCDKAINYKDRIKTINQQPCYINAKTKKSGIVEKEVSSLIYDIDVNDKGIYALLAFGNINLRIDKFAEKLNEELDLDIELSDIARLEQYINDKGKLVKAGEYIKGLK